MRSHLIIITAAALLLSVTVSSSALSASSPSSASWWWLGVNFLNTPYEYDSPLCNASLAALTSHGALGGGANTVGFTLTWFQENCNSTQIGPAATLSPTDESLVAGVKYARLNGAKYLVLKPMVDFLNDSSHWRGEIGLGWGNNDTMWELWFQSYATFMFHYGVVAEQNGFDALVVGTELISATAWPQNEARWRALIAGLRLLFSGLLTFAANHDGEEFAVRFWDALDVIGVDAYHPLSNSNTPTPSVSVLVSEWQPYVMQLKNLSSFFNKPLVFTEIGYASQAYSTYEPWNFNDTAPPDLQIQANAYAAMCEVFAPLSWFRGVLVWAWYSSTTAGGADDDGFSPQNKPLSLAAMRACQQAKK